MSFVLSWLKQKGPAFNKQFSIQSGKCWGKSPFNLKSHSHIVPFSLSLLQLSWTAYKYLSRWCCGWTIGRKQTQQLSHRCMRWPSDDSIHPIIVIVDINNQSSCQHGNRKEARFWLLNSIPFDHHRRRVCETCVESNNSDFPAKRNLTKWRLREKGKTLPVN